MTWQLFSGKERSVTQQSQARKSSARRKIRDGQPSCFAKRNRQFMLPSDARSQSVLKEEYGALPAPLSPRHQCHQVVKSRVALVFKKGLATSSHPLERGEYVAHKF